MNYLCLNIIDVLSFQSIHSLFLFSGSMYRLRALTAATVGMVQLSRRHHSGAFRSHQRRRVMLAALAGVTGITASAGLMWTRYKHTAACIQSYK